MANELNDVLKQLAAKGEADIIRRIRQLNLVDTSKLLNSIKVSSLTGSEQGLLIEKNYVTVFIETGTGKGQKQGQAGKRKPLAVTSQVIKELRRTLEQKAISISSQKITGMIKMEFSKQLTE